MAMGNLKKQNLIFFIIVLFSQIFLSCGDIKETKNDTVKFQKNKAMDNELPKRFNIKEYEANLKK